MNEKIKYCLSVNKGIWHVSFRLEQEDGSKKLKCLSTKVNAGKDGKSNKRLAEKSAIEIVAKYENVVYSDKAELFLGDYVREWVKRNADIQPSTKDGYLHMIDKHIAPYFAERGIKLKAVKPMHIQEFMNDRIESGLSANTVGKQYTLIKTALKDAVANEFIKSNSADRVKKPKKVKPQHSFYTAEQLRTLIQVTVGTNMELPVMLAVLFGLRRSEVLGVKWSAIDFDNMTLTVSEKITRQKDENGQLHDVASDQLKTQASYDTYYLNDAVCAYLSRKQAEQALLLRETNDYIDYVCVDEVGNLLKLDFITSKFSKFLKANNLPHIRFHDLRHSCITMLANNSDFTMKQVQDYARHANFALTADTYSHVLTDSKLTELNAICTSLKIGETA